MDTHVHSRKNRALQRIGMTRNAGIACSSRPWDWWSDGQLVKRGFQIFEAGTTLWGNQNLPELSCAANPSKGLIDGEPPSLLLFPRIGELIIVKFL